MHYPFISGQMFLSDCKLARLNATRMEESPGLVLFPFLFAINLLWSNGLTVLFVRGEASAVWFYFQSNFPNALFFFKFFEFIAGLNNLTRFLPLCQGFCQGFQREHPWALCCSQIQNGRRGMRWLISDRSNSDMITLELNGICWFFFPSRSLTRPLYFQ